MKINSISNNYLSNYRIQGKNPSFGTAYVTAARANLAPVICENVDKYNNGDFTKMYDSSKISAQEVIDKVNKSLPNSNKKIKTVKDLVTKTDFYVLAAGAGKRFAPMAALVADMRGKGESFNKISLPFELGNGQEPLTMLDVPLSMGRFFADKEGYRKIVAEQPTGSFGDIILNYINSGEKPKDVVVCCGDNIFDAKGEEMLEYLVGTINNPDKQLGVVGVARTPEQVAKTFGVLEVGEKDEKTGLYPLKGFVEKPELEKAKNLTTPDGNCVANTGMFVIKKETMEKLIDIIKHEQKVLDGKTFYIAKDEKEKFDFANATKWANKLNGPEASDVKIVKTWEDVGSPKAYYNWLATMKDGHYLSNFTPERQTAINNAIQTRVKNYDTYKSIQFTVNPKNTGKVEDIYIQA